MLFTALIATTLFLCRCTKEDEKKDPTPATPATSLTVSPTNLSFSCLSGEEKVTVTANSSWTVSSDQSWCTVSPASGSNNGTLTVKVGANTQASDRKATVTVTSGTGTTAVTKTIAVTQLKKDVFSIEQKDYEVSILGDTITVALTLYAEYTFESKADWIHSVSTKAQSTGREAFLVDANDQSSKEARDGIIIFQSDGEKDTVRVHQDGGNLFYIVQRNYAVFDKDTTITVDIKSNVPFTYSISEEDWIRDVSDADASKQFKFYIEANSTYDPRTGQIVFCSEEGICYPVTVTQMQKDAIVLSLSTIEVEAVVGTITVEVLSNMEYDVEIEESCDWIHYTATKGLTASTFLLTLDDNETGKERSARVHVVSGQVSQYFTVVQKVMRNVDIPDQEFRAYILPNFDTNQDGALSIKEAAQITKIDVITDNIRSLEGIENFSNLESLSCSSSNKDVRSPLSNLDVSLNTKLTHLYCNYTSVTTLDLSRNKALRVLHAKMNLLKDLNLSGHSTLDTLDCAGNGLFISTGVPNGNLESLNLDGCTSLHYLDCSYNAIEYVDLSDCKELVGLSIRYVKNPSIDLSLFPNLEYFDGSYCTFTQLDVSNNPKLETLAVSMLKLSSMDLSHNPELRTFIFYNSSSLQHTLDFSQNRNLRVLYISEYPMAYLNLSNNTKLHHVDISASLALKEIWLAPDQDIETLHISDEVAVRRVSSFELTQSEYAVSNLGDKIEVEVLSDDSYTVKVNNDWIQELTTKATSHHHTFQVAANGGEARSGTIHFITSYNDTTTVTLHQSAGIVADECWKEKDFYHRSLATRFTATWCGYCPRIGTALTDANASYPDRIEQLTLHPNSSDSRLAFAGTAAIERYYSLVGYPTCVMDSRALVDYAAQIVAVVQETGQNYGTSTGISFNSVVKDSALTLDLSLYFKQSGDYLVTVFLIEDNIVTPQKNYYGTDYTAYTHMAVARKAISALTGDVVSITNDYSVFTKHYATTLSSDYVTENCRVLVYVQKQYGTTRPQNVENVTYNDFGGYYVDNSLSGKIGETIPLAFEAGS